MNRIHEPTSAVGQAQALLSRCRYGVLSSMSVRQPGYPLGSVTPYVLDEQNQPIILISEIAQHTANLKTDGRCSLTMTASTAPGFSLDTPDNVQAEARLCVMADAQLLDEPELEPAAARYLRFFPESEDYFTTHDFRFWRLRPVKLRFIGGFGQIHWFDPDAVLTPNPFSSQAETSACVHMNADHLDALCSYCDFAGIVRGESQPSLVGVDAHALHVRVGGAVYRLAFRAPVSNLDELRQETIAMCCEDYWRELQAA